MKINDKVLPLSYTYRGDFNPPLLAIMKYHMVDTDGNFKIGIVTEIRENVTGYNVKVKFNNCPYYFSFKENELIVEN